MFGIQMLNLLIACATGERIGIEVDGPHHFTTNTLTLTGDTVARQRLLRARGWAIISVPYFFWASSEDDVRVSILKKVRRSCFAPAPVRDPRSLFVLERMLKVFAHALVDFASCRMAVDAWWY